MNQLLRPKLPVTSYQLPGSGFTMIELLIATFVVGTVMVGVFGLFILSLRSAQEGERRVVAIALANERAEMIRNLAYGDVGTVGGIPAGSIPQSEVVVRNALSYTVMTDIRYVDDPFDGTLGSGGQNCVQICHMPPGNPSSQSTLCVPQSAVDAHLAHGDSSGPCEGGGTTEPDTVNTDYKQARIEVSWNSPNQIKPILLLTQIAPVGIEEGETAGTLDFQALDAQGQGVEGAQLHLVNGSVNPAVNITTSTNSEGRVVLPGLPVSSDSYALTISKADYTSEQTYDTLPTFIPDLDYRHLSTIVGQVTSKTFAIDRLSTVTIETDDEAGKKIKDVAYTLRGTKTIGLDDNEQPVYRQALVGTTGPSGMNIYNDVVWDAYDLLIDGAASGYDIKETSVVLPTPVDPNSTVTITTTLVPHTPISLQLTVLSPQDGPVDNATVTITGGGFQGELGTGAVGQVYFGDLPSNTSYDVTVDAPGYTSYAGTLTVQDTTRARLNLAPSL